MIKDMLFKDVKFLVKYTRLRIMANLLSQKDFEEGLSQMWHDYHLEIANC